MGAKITRQTTSETLSLEVASIGTSVIYTTVASKITEIGLNGGDILDDYSTQASISQCLNDMGVADKLCIAKIVRAIKGALDSSSSSSGSHGGNSNPHPIPNPNSYSAYVHNSNHNSGTVPSDPGYVQKVPTPARAVEGPRPDELLTLSPEQHQLLVAVMQKKSIFFTGPAGTGKSYLLQVLQDVLRLLRKTQLLGITASTGISAINIGGTTIHCGRAWA